MLHLLRVKMVINSPWIMPIPGTKELASPEQMAPDVVFSRDILMICADFSSIQVKTQSSRYVVPTGRVVVPTGRYVVPAGNVIVVSTGRLSVIPTGHGSLSCENVFLDENLDAKLKEFRWEIYLVMGQMEVKMTTSSANNSVFRGFFEKQKLTGPNFIDWYRQLRIVLSIEDKLNYLEQPIPPAPVVPAGQHVAPEILAAHTAWIKGSKEIAASRAGASSNYTRFSLLKAGRRAVGHWKRNCPQYLAELLKKKKNATSGAGGSGSKGK
nr:zinc finger, CCHC-type [Tanacetum cinerariifolium]